MDTQTPPRPVQTLQPLHLRILPNPTRNFPQRTEQAHGPRQLGSVRGEYTGALVIRSPLVRVHRFPSLSYSGLKTNERVWRCQRGNPLLFPNNLEGRGPSPLPAPLLAPGRGGGSHPESGLL